MLERQAVYLQPALFDLFEAERSVEKRKHAARKAADPARELAAVAQETGLLQAEQVLKDQDIITVPRFDIAWAIINQFSPEKNTGPTKAMARRRWIAAGFPV